MRLNTLPDHKDSRFLTAERGRNGLFPLKLNAKITGLLFQVQEWYSGL